MQKHLPLLLACIMFAGSIFAQQHLSFKGVPIDGTLKAYTDAMDCHSHFSYLCNFFFVTNFFMKK